MSKFLAIVNPAAGGGRCGRLADEAVEALRGAGLDIEVARTRAAGEGTTLARAAYKAGVRDFVAVGGDGTSFEIVNGLFPEALESEQKPTLGFLPLGTGNSFLRDFSSEGATYAAEALRSGRKRACDVIRLRHKEGELFYINILSLGFVADVCTVANERFKRFGELGYGLGVAVTVASLACEPIPFTIDGGARDEQPMAFISISNSRFTGGKMMMAPGADVADGLADVVTVGRIGRFRLLRTFPKIFDGSHVAQSEVRAVQARSMEFHVSAPRAAMIDGEVISLWPERLDVLQHALEVRV
jgi:YegS/Rv2252/BmrU family lipid kinase